MGLVLNTKLHGPAGLGSIIDYPGDITIVLCKVYYVINIFSFNGAEFPL